ncbi:MAG TPA: hypothetical protein VF268_13975 [Gammaproteobacteria bacterium]
MKRKIKLNEGLFVPIMGDGAIASESTAEGRAIPVLILDCKNHKELVNHIHIHEHSPPGDVLCTWAANKRYAFLIFEFYRPTQVKVGVKFDLVTEGGLADAIVQSQGVYIQPAESGKTVAEGLENPKILVEVNPKTKLPDWDERLLKILMRQMKKEGLSKREAKNASYEFLCRTREFWKLRMEGA